MCFTGFGGQQAGFGAQQQQQQQGTRGITYQKVQEMEGGTGSGAAGGQKTAVQFCTILALPQFKEPHEKSAAELRWEDYQVRSSHVMLVSSWWFCGCYFPDRTLLSPLKASRYY